LFWSVFAAATAVKPENVVCNLRAQKNRENNNLILTKLKLNIMKNLLKSTLYLFVFALAGILFQISCSNSDNVNQTSSVNSTPIGKIVFAKRPNLSDWQIWTCNYDGTNLNQIPITLPPNVVFNFSNLQTNIKLSPDGQKVFFVCFHNSLGLIIYSCDIDGSNLQPVTTQTDAGNIELGGAY
jgi:hypothetical protein